MSIVNSLVDDIIMPPIGLATGGIDFAAMMLVLKAGNPPPPYTTPAAAKAAGAVTINYGQFVNSVITFLIIAIVVFLLVKAVNRLYESRKGKSEEEVKPVTKECPYCTKEIPLNAKRCPECTSILDPKLQPDERTVSGPELPE